MIVELTTTETMPCYFDWATPEGEVIAHNVPEGDSPILPKGWRWVSASAVKIPTTAERLEAALLALPGVTWAEVDEGVRVRVQLEVEYPVADEGAQGGAQGWTDQSEERERAVADVLRPLGIEFVDASSDDGHHETMVYRPSVLAPEGVEQDIWSLLQSSDDDDISVARDRLMEIGHRVADLL